jgi:hypothetical protein
MNRKLLLCVVSGALLVAAAAWADPKEDVIAAFFKVDQAVVNGDLNAVKTAASDLAQKAQLADSQAILKDANDLAKADSIDQARQLQKALGEDILGLVKTREGSRNTAPDGCPMMGSRNTAPDGCPMMGSQNTASDGRPMMGSQNAVSGACPMMGSQNAASATCRAMMDMMRRCSSM